MRVKFVGSNTVLLVNLAGCDEKVHYSLLSSALHNLSLRSQNCSRL